MQSSSRSNSWRIWIAVGLGALVVTAALVSFAMPSPTTLDEQKKESEMAMPPGALVTVGFNGQVGVLLDEIPQSIRDRAVKSILEEKGDFWKVRAADQIRLMSYRLIFRDSYYDESEGKGALPLPPEQVWDIQIDGSPKRFTTEEGNHDIVAVNYSFSSVLLTDIESPGMSEPNLESIGGKWSEHFILPIDPTLLFQRTRFACMDENQFPPRSVDAEETDTFYDQETDVEDELSIEGFHQTEMPEMSCIEALDSKVGKVEADLDFERIAWDSTLADKVRVGAVTNPESPDLKIEDSTFKTNRLAYRYITPDDCALAEGSVGDTGWRRLLQFSAADRNVGARELEIGDIDYYIEGRDTELSNNGIYEYSVCHDHYHFVHYGTFSFGDSQTHKMGFCLQSTNRFSNNEYSPLPNRYAGCDFQGIESGWVDEYKIGLEGQWVDVTDVNTPVTRQLEFHSNPLGFLCEGKPVTDSEGYQVYEMTQLKTADGHSVFKPRCEYGDGALENNFDSYEVTLPGDGHGYVTEECSRGETGPLRNCGFVKSDSIFNCTPRHKVNLMVTLPEQYSLHPQIVRLCEFSAVLNTAIPCTYNGPHNAQAILNDVVESNTNLVFECPGPLDGQELGGKFSVYFAPVLPEDMPADLQFSLL
ncbi:MAG TPA: lysyl oxidase family protein [Nitrososphaera sp.]|nr:lysyl oxidase family protein [Nitrososphaera sp.]